MEQAGFDALDPETTPHVMGLFNESHMQYEANRDNDIAGEPSLTEMTLKAIAVLDNNDKGYFLSVDSGRIDHSHQDAWMFRRLYTFHGQQIAIVSALAMVLLFQWWLDCYIWHFCT